MTILDLTEQEENIAENARNFVRTNKKYIIDKFASIKEHPSQVKPVSVFLAGSPGAGKTEFSKRFVGNPVRVDADAVREMLPQYHESSYNSNLVQGACGLAVDKLFEHTLDHRQHVILDATFSDFNKSLLNVTRSLSRKRKVEIFYIYQDPLVAWDWTKKREALEKRPVPIEIFINSFTLSRENVNKVKTQLGTQIKLNFIHRDYTDSTKDREYLDIINVDDYLEKKYTKSELERIIL